jgi:hypothetical protein
MKFAKTLLALAVVGAAFSAQAESQLQTGVGALSSTGHLNINIVVPKVMYLQVGTGTVAAPSATIDTVNWTLTAAQVGSATAITGTPTAALNARVVANNGNVTFTATGSGTGLVGPVGSAIIPWSQILPTASAGTLIHPPITGVAQTVTATSGVVNQTATYAFDYSNTNAQMAGTYTGVVTYTASIL